MTKPIAQTERTRLRRLPKRGNFDRDTIYSILDEALICHVGFVVDGQPYVIPTGYGRIDDQLYIHGSSASRMVRSLADTGRSFRSNSSANLESCVETTICRLPLIRRSRSVKPSIFARSLK